MELAEDRIFLGYFVNRGAAVSMGLEVCPGLVKEDPRGVKEEPQCTGLGTEEEPSARRHRSVAEPILTPVAPHPQHRRGGRQEQANAGECVRQRPPHGLPSHLRPHRAALRTPRRAGPQVVAAGHAEASTSESAPSVPCPYTRRAPHQEHETERPERHGGTDWCYRRRMFKAQIQGEERFIRGAMEPALK
jgi:hypothetical protein